MIDVLFAPRPQVLEHFTSLLGALETYAQEVEFLRDYHTGVDMFGTAIGACRQALADPTAHPLELAAAFHVALEVRIRLHHDVMALIHEAEAKGGAHD